MLNLLPWKSVKWTFKEKRALNEGVNYSVHQKK